VPGTTARLTKARIPAPQRDRAIGSCSVAIWRYEPSRKDTVKKQMVAVAGLAILTERTQCAGATGWSRMLVLVISPSPNPVDPVGVEFTNGG
jgi:hypothetical protein